MGSLAGTKGGSCRLKSSGGVEGAGWTCGTVAVGSGSSPAGAEVTAGVKMAAGAGVAAGVEVPMGIEMPAVVDPELSVVTVEAGVARVDVHGPGDAETSVVVEPLAWYRAVALGLAVLTVVVVSLAVELFTQLPSLLGRQLMHCFPAFTQAQALQEPVLLHLQHTILIR